MNKPLFVRPAMSVEARPDEERAQYLARKVARLIRKEKWHDIVSALFGVTVHVLLRHSNDLEQALENVDRLSTDMKAKLVAIWEPHKALDNAAQQLERESANPDGRPN